MSSIKKFKAKLMSVGGGGVFVYVPFDVEKEYGKKNMIPVKATYEGEPYTGSIANMGDGPCLIILKSIREKIGKQVGDTVTVTVELDTTPRKVELPNELKIMLNKNKEEKEFFNSLSFTNQKEYAKWITDAKREETKLARLESLLDKLKAKKKNPTAS
jgi:hypothetical protein